MVRRLTGKDPRQDVRRPLRDVKSLVETGEVVRPDEPTTGKRTPVGSLVQNGHPRVSPRIELTRPPRIGGA